MEAHTKEQFEAFMGQLLETNASLGFFTDFAKCHANVSRVAMKLNQLNYLIGKSDMERAVNELWEENPRAFSVLGILIAVREKDGKKVVGTDRRPRLIETYFDSPSGVVEYLEGTGLADVLRNKHVNNLVDYVFGVEVGLDTNARKNRSGHIMEELVADVLAANGIEYRREVYSTEFASMHRALGEDTKRFDFAIATAAKTYLIEVNFYSSGGSKLNEVARAYTDLCPKVNSCPGFEFVWITDGVGWNSARNKLEEAFYAIPSIYNITTIGSFIDTVRRAQGH